MNSDGTMTSERFLEMFAAMRQAQRSRHELTPALIGDHLTRYQRAACLLDFEEAHRIGEIVLSCTRDSGHLRTLCAPFVFERCDVRAIPDDYRKRSLARADRYIAKHSRSPWGYLFRWLLNRALKASYREMHSDVRKLSAFCASKYGWLGAETGKHLLATADFAGAVVQLETAAVYARPVDWISRCQQAEALLCRGKLKSALSLFDGLQDAAGAQAGGCVLAWKAKLLMWAGRYSAALKILRSAEVSSSPYVQTSVLRGAALLKLGCPNEALFFLTPRGSQSQQDLECSIWKIETFNQLGRHAEALEEARRAESLNASVHNLYFHAVRGLSRAAGGDVLGMREDYNAVRQRDHILNFMARQQRRLERYDDASILHSLVVFLRLSKGVRASNHELYAISGYRLSAASRCLNQTAPQGCSA